MNLKSPQKSCTSAGFIIVLMLLTVYGCGSQQTLQQVYATQDPYLGSPYPAALERWTRKNRIYMGGLDLEMNATATFKTFAYREAYTDEYARTYQLDRAEQEKMRQDQSQSAKLYNDFIVSVFIPDKQWNDLDTKKSIWKVYLKRDNDVRISPVEIRRFKPMDAVLTHFFPYISPWDVVYLLRFPATLPGTDTPLYSDESAPIRLIITGVRGTAELIWEGSH